MARLGIQSERIKHLVDTQVLPFLLAAGNVAALTNLLNAEFPLATDSCRRAWDHSHSIINRSRKPAWLKGFAMIDMGHYRRFYRHPTRALSGAEDGEICGATTLATPSSITF